MSELQVNIAGVSFKNPVLAASGTFGFGREYGRLYDISKLGGICCKAVTLEERQGNPPPRIAETPSGMLNSVGLQNMGVDYFLGSELPFMRRAKAAVIVNIAGRTAEEYRAVAEKLNDSDIAMIELNISCPNVKEGGAAFGVNAASAANVTRQVRRHCKKPLMVKLSPNAANIAEIAAAVESEGADAVSLINTITGMRIDLKSRRPVLHTNTGGLSGPAVFPVAVRMVWEVYKRVKIPVVGAGGIASWQDAAEMMMAGASAVQVGSAMFLDPYAPLKIIDGLRDYAAREKLQNISEIVGSVKAYE
ncbi:MAG TPA: dihydroorotate dehydrogenase [Ruminococcaceae bacterium]|nr:dihydroorotate dehydrogenase [Oscillospiraceae bacterium]